MFASLWLQQLRRRLFVRSSNNSWRKSPSATTRRRVRLNLEALEDRLTPSADAVQTTAVALSTPYSENSQTVQMSANVTDNTTPGTTISEGTVTFTVDNSSGTQIGTASGTVSGGTANANFTLPSEPPGTYTINVSYSDVGGPNSYTDGGDTPADLTVTPAKVLVAAQNVSAVASSADQSVTLKANVSDDSFSSDTVGEGTVTFTVKDSKGNTIGSPVPSSTVSNGSASATFTLPANTAPGTYTVAVSYSDSSGNFTDDGTDTSGTLTVATATTTTASNVTATFSPNAQTVTLSANVASNGSPVTQGKVSFLLFDSNGNTVGTAATASVTSAGSASVSYGLPAYTLVGSYTIEADYSDSSGTYAASSDATHTLSVTAAPTTTTASSATANFSPSDQTVTLSASVTSNGNPVNEGSVTFMLLNGDGNMVGTTTSANVSNGSASASFVLPGGTVPGSYSIQASYTDSSGNFAASSDTTQMLTVNAVSTSVGLLTASITPNLSNSTAQVTLTAQVNNSAGTVNEGSVSFTLADVTSQGAVSNGTATVHLTVPLGQVMNLSNVTLSYSDAGGAGDFGTGSSSARFTTNIVNALLPSNVKFALDGTEQIDVQLGGQSLLGYIYSPSGLLTQINVGSSFLPVTYTNVSGGVLVEIDGVPWQVNLLSSNGQPQAIAQLSLNPDGSTQWLFVSSSGQILGALPS